MTSRRSLAAAAVLLAAGMAHAEAGPVAISIYSPSTFFAGAEGKAAFASDIESVLSEALGRPVVASFSSDAKRLGSDPLWLLDAAEAAARADAVVIFHARRAENAHGVMALYSHKAWPNAFALLSKGKVLLPGGGATDRDTLRFWLLYNEPASAEIAKRLRPARDARAALASVAAKESDGALVLKLAYGSLDAGLGGLREVTGLGEVALPVLAINRKAIDRATLNTWQRQLKKAKLPQVKGAIDSWTPVTPGDWDRLVQTMRNKTSPVRRDFLLEPLPPLKIELWDLLPPPPAAKPLDATVVLPPRRYQPLPDPPYEPRGTASAEPSDLPPRVSWASE